MAEIAGQQGAALTNELAQYLQNADGEVSSEELAGIINEYLSGNDQLSNRWNISSIRNLQKVQ